VEKNWERRGIRGNLRTAGKRERKKGASKCQVLYADDKKKKKKYYCRTESQDKRKEEQPTEGSSIGGGKVWAWSTRGWTGFPARRKEGEGKEGHGQKCE